MPEPAPNSSATESVRHTSPRLLLGTGEGCHYCDRAPEVLASLGIEFEELAVDSPAARDLARAGLPLAFLPVLTDGVRVIAYGRFSERALQREFAR